MLNDLDAFGRECMTIQAWCSLSLTDLANALTQLVILWIVPVFIRSDNGPKVTPFAVRDWINDVGAEIAVSNLAYCGKLIVARASMPASTTNRRMVNVQSPMNQGFLSNNGAAPTTKATPQCIGISATGVRKYRSNGPKADHVLNFMRNRSNESDQ